MSIVNGILVLHFINSKKCTKYQFIIACLLESLLSNEYTFMKVNIKLETKSSRILPLTYVTKYDLT